MYYSVHTVKHYTTMTYNVPNYMKFGNVDMFVIYVYCYVPMTICGFVNELLTFK